MITRSSIVAIDQSATPDEITELVSASTRSRYPVVVDGDLDHVVGMLHIKDFIRASRIGTFVSLADILRPLPVVAATTSAEDLLEQFKLGTAHAALVVDEFGTTVGFVSLDDVIDEIIEDETSEQIVRHPDGSMSVVGEAPLSELREELDDPLFDHDDVVTIAGLVLARAGVVPAVGGVVRLGPYELVVEQLDGRKITRVRIRVVDDQA